MPDLSIIWWVAVASITYEAIMWGWTLYRHATWLKAHPAMEKRVAVSYRVLRMSAVMSSSLSILIWLLFIYITVHELVYTQNSEIWVSIRNLCIIFLQLSHVHFSAIIARYSCLPRSMWPLLSKGVSIMLVKVFRMNPPILTSYDVHTCWHSRAGKDLKEKRENGK